MSKQQTPIDKLEDDLHEYKYGEETAEFILEKIEQYTKANHRQELINLLVWLGNGYDLDKNAEQIVDEYYETEVKPKYEKKNS